VASATALPRPRRRPARRPNVVVPLVVALAAAAGGLAAFKPSFGIALVGAAVVGLFVTWDISSLPYFLIFTMFVESVSLGPGLRIGRVFGGLALLVLAITLLTRGRAGLRTTALMAVAGGYGLWIFASALWASSPSTVPSATFSYVLSASYALTVAVLVRRREQLFGLARVLAIGSTIFGIAAFVYYVRHTAVTPNDIGGRAAGLQGDPNYFAIFQVIAMPPALVLAARERHRGWRALYYGVVGVIVVSVISSLSRTGLIALVFAVLLTLVLPWRIFFSAPAQKLTYLVAIVLGAGAATAIGSTALVARVQTILNPNAQGSYRGAGREDLWRAALNGWHQSNEVIGMGAGNFKLYSLDLLQSTPGVDTTQNYVRPFREVHNAYLENLTDLGVVGLTLFLLLLFLTGRSLIRSFGRARAAGDLDLQRFSLAFLVSLVGYALSAIFLSNQLAKALWLLVGIALALDVMTRRLGPRAAAGAYDAGVLRGGFEEQERRLQDVLHALVLDQQRIDRRRAALDERERQLEAREQALREGLAGGEEEVARRAQELDERERRLEAELSAVLADQQRLLEAQERIVDMSSAEVAARQAELEERQRSIDVAQAAVAAERHLLARDAEQRARERAELAKATAEASRTLAELEAREHALRGSFTGDEYVERRAAELDERERRLEAELAERTTALDAAERSAQALMQSLETRERELTERQRAVDLDLESVHLERVRLAATQSSTVADVDRTRTELDARLRELEAKQERLWELRAQLEADAQRRAREYDDLVRRTADVSNAETALTARATEVEARERALGEREERIRAELESVLDEQSRLLEAQDRIVDLSAAEVAERRRELDERQAALERERDEVERGRADAQQLSQHLAAEQEQVTARSARLVESEARIEALAGELAEREDRLRQTEEELAARIAELERVIGAVELDVAPIAPAPPVAQPPVAAPPLPAPTPPPPVEAPQAPAPGAPSRLLEPYPGEWDVAALEELVMSSAAQYPRERVDEWTAYVVYLRGYAVDEILPPAFDPLVHDIFGELLESRRRGA
jgi:O-antigen ligase